MENSHQEEEDNVDIFAEDDTNTSTPSEGDDSGKLSDEDFLAKWNEVSGRKDKTLDAVRKHQEEVRKAFSEKGRKKEEDGQEETKVPKETVSPSNLILKDLYFDHTFSQTACPMYMLARLVTQSDVNFLKQRLAAGLPTKQLVIAADKELRELTDEVLYTLHRGWNWHIYAHYNAIVNF
jgi:hypothetical protein